MSRAFWSNETLIKVYSKYSHCTGNFIWKYDFDGYSKFYSKYVSKSTNHLEIGVASVRDLISCDIESKQHIKICLLDFERAPLEYAENALLQNGFPKENINIIHDDVLRTDAFEFTDTFDTISCGLLLHCLPTSMDVKLNKLLENVSTGINEKTNVFGTTWLQPDMNDKSLAAFIINKQQKNGVLFNQNDQMEDLTSILNEHFAECNVETIGYITEFEACQYKKSSKGINTL